MRYSQITRYIGIAGLILAGGISTPAQQLDAKKLDGLRFRNIGPAVMSGRVVDLAVVEDEPYTFYVATATGGLWKTENNGVIFKPVFEHEAVHSIGAVAVHPADKNTLWVGSGERANRQSSSWGDGIYKSSDAGNTWTNMGLRDSHHIGRIALHPTDTNLVYVAAMGHLWGSNEERGLYRSKDGGQTWQRILEGNRDTGVVDVAMDPEDPSILYAAKYQRRRRPFGFHGGGPGSGLFKSVDGGDTWKELTEGLPDGDKGRIGISIYRSDPRIVYVSVEQGFRYNASTAYTERRAGVYRSEDRGETWEFRSDWNPRPMYASQILVDPSNDQRVYMMNRYSYSDDGGKTFEAARQTLHGDDRIVWVNPQESRHVIKGDDGGVGISYDRGLTWLYVTSLPVSQYYRISLDMRDPYWVHGGLQDNGSWAGPNATYRSEGILNEDWIKTGGGDGFVNRVHPDHPNMLFTESQYLGLSLFDLETRERRWLRPGDPLGNIQGRRNWDSWGPGTRDPELGNAMAPANWDGPFILSSHDPHTIYAGTNILWKSVDLGASWKSLGDLTTKVNRRELRIMGQRPEETTLSLDDGIPYYPTLTVLAESPFRSGVLIAGTDDGNLQVSTDDGVTWTELADRLPGLPSDSWLSGVEFSKFSEGRVYVTANNYRNDDFSNYVYQSNDNGQTWRSIAGDLPARPVLRTLREDARNPDLLFLAAELGFFVSFDQGGHWTEFKSNMPRVAINDLKVHPRDNDLVLGTHGRGIWILDQINALQEIGDAASASEALFSIEPARMIRYARERGHVGNMIYQGENPPAGAIIDYYLAADQPADAITLSLVTPSGEVVALKPATKAGVNRVIWDLRYPRIPGPSQARGGGGQGRGGSGLAGPWVEPGLYRVRLEVAGRVHEQPLTVAEDTRISVGTDQRIQWTRDLRSIGRLYQWVMRNIDAVGPVHEKIDALAKKGTSIDGDVRIQVQDLNRRTRELLSRVQTLYSRASDWTGPLTADQKTQWQYFQDRSQSIQFEVDELLRVVVPRLNQSLPAEDRIGG